jgi:transcription elongation factor GreA
MSPARPAVPTIHQEHAMTVTVQPDPSEVYLTPQGRRSLEARAGVLRDEVIPRLAALSDTDERDDTTTAQHESAVAELARIRHALAHARPTESLPDDPLVVELGETVTIRLDGDAPEQYVIVDPNEALVSGGPQVSAHSPLGRALLGRRVGDEVDVPAPGGHYRCTIESATRTTPGSRAR